MLQVFLNRLRAEIAAAVVGGFHDGIRALSQSAEQAPQVETIEADFFKLPSPELAAEAPRARKSRSQS